VIEAGAAVAELVTTEPPEGNYQVHPGGVEEVVADKGGSVANFAADMLVG
jgi:hypothetical protein